MTEQQINIPLLRKSVEWVEEQAKLREIDREWDQKIYVGGPYAVASRMLMLEDHDVYVSYLIPLAAHCGTAYCVAGKIGADHEDGFKHADVAEIDGEPVFVSDYARKKLGISVLDAAELFRGKNSAADVRRIAERIAGERL